MVTASVPDTRKTGPTNPVVLQETKRRADRARKTFVGRALGVMVAGILLNEETPSWGDGAVAVTIYAGEFRSSDYG